MTSLAKKVLRGDPLPGEEAATEATPIADPSDMRKMSSEEFTAFLAQTAKGVGRGKQVLKTERQKAGRKAVEGKFPAIENMVKPVNPNTRKSMAREETVIPKSSPDKLAMSPEFLDLYLAKRLTEGSPK